LSRRVKTEGNHRGRVSQPIQFASQSFTRTCLCAEKTEQAFFDCGLRVVVNDYEPPHVVSFV
jgi:hypothetical protein